MKKSENQRIWYFQSMNETILLADSKKCYVTYSLLLASYLNKSKDTDKLFKDSIKSCEMHKDNIKNILKNDIKIIRETNQNNAQRLNEFEKKYLSGSKDKKAE